MKRTIAFLLLFVLLLAVGSARAIDQAMPNQMPAGHTAMTAAPEPDEPSPLAAQDRTKFRAGIKLDDLRLLAVQHNDQVKILDSWARQSLSTIRNLQKIDGEDPLYTALDMAFRHDAWLDKNIIYVQAIPIRQQLAKLVSDPVEQKRIIEHATVSPRFLERREAQELLAQIKSNVPLAQAVDKVLISEETFDHLYETLLMVPPMQSGQPWMHAAQFGGNIPEMVKLAGANAQSLPTVPGVDIARSKQIFVPFFGMGEAWAANDAVSANSFIADLVRDYPTLQPDYPPLYVRKLELFYNHTFNGTIVAFVYFLAFVLFTVGAMAQQPRTRNVGYAAFTLAVLCHILAMSVRWYLAGRIPIQNQFESVLGAALIGCIVGLVAESIKRNGLFGMAFSFVGFLAMTCCFVFPFVIGKSIGENIGKVAGILNNTAWLYIHVNTVIASYALIAAAAVLGGVYLAAKTWHWINPLTDDPRGGLAISGSDAGPSLQSAQATDHKLTSSGAVETLSLAAIESNRRSTLERIDSATVILLQMAMWVLGTGIVFGAIWADVSWGRPWGWDPKETFALVTWIVYLVIIHVRFITPSNRATVTAILAVVGLLIMLFNWIGVNFWLAGLHSYA